MSVAVKSIEAVNPEVVIPMQCRLLGAKVKGIGVITTVSVQNIWRWGLVERPDGTETHVFLCDLKKGMVELPSELQPYIEMTRRVGYGLFERVYQLPETMISDLTHDLEPLEAYALQAA